MADELQVERRGRVLVVTIDRQERMNSLSPAVNEGLEATWESLKGDRSVRAIVITGAGDRAFCTGMDLKAAAERGGPRPVKDDVHEELRLTPLHCDVWLPTIVAVNGVCTGSGLHFVADADVVVASSTATFLDTHVSVGQVTAIEPITLLPRIGLGNALRLAVLGRHGRIDAAEALRISLVDEVVEPGQLARPRGRVRGAREQWFPGRGGGVEARDPRRARAPDGRGDAARLGAADRAPRAPRLRRGAEGVRREARAEVAVSAAGVDQDVEAIVAEADRFFRKQLPADWVAAVDADDPEALAAARRAVDPDEIWARIAAGGYSCRRGPRSTAVWVSERRVGAAISRALGRYRMPRFNNVVGVDLVGPAILQWGTAEHKARYLRGIAASEDIWCQLFSEPGAGSDLAGLATRAVRDGDTWVVRGQKVWTSLADVASYGILLARTNPEVPKHQGITAFLVPMHHPGVTVRPLRQITGDAEYCEVFFDEARFDDSARLGDVDEGWRVAISVLDERAAVVGWEWRRDARHGHGSLDRRAHPASRPGDRPGAPPAVGAGLYRGQADLVHEPPGRRSPAGRPAAGTGRLDREALLQRAHAAGAEPGRRPGGSGPARLG